MISVGIIKEAKKRTLEEGRELTNNVRQIIDEVIARGDEALIEYNSRFDGNTREKLRVGEEEIQQAYEAVDNETMEALKTAVENIRNFAKLQRDTIGEIGEEEVYPGVFAGHRAIAIESCCCYVPGGGYPLFSTALMLAIPAKVAGVRRVTACSPTMKDSEKIHPLTLVAMDMAGVDEIYALGGAHAIGAFTYGTEQIKAVDIIVGPGNQYVTEAKRQCYGRVGIDFIAGPSEVLIIADGSGDPEIIAADLLGQSEHDLMAKGILITNDKGLAHKTLIEVDKQLDELATQEIARRAWEDNGEIVVVKSLDEACSLANEYAPEHLEIMVKDYERIIDKLVNYGSLFIGEMSAEVFGDYISGPNHTLPTLRAARYTGGVWVGTFIKICTHQRLTREAMTKIGKATSLLARAEGLQAHARAVDIRLNKLP